jgi:hypothetical protein
MARGKAVTFTMADWFTIEVFSGDKLAASAWRYSYGDALTEAAATSGALYWDWHDSQYGVVFEVCFATDDQWETFRALPPVVGALDAVPDPVSGLLVYRGRGGAAGARKPRSPRPAPSAAALELAEASEERRIRLLSALVRAGPGIDVYLPENRAADGEPRYRTVQDGPMTETRVRTEDLRIAIEHAGYYPGLVIDAVASALGHEPVTAFFVQHDALFDPGMEVRRHMTVLALTPTRLVYSHTDEHPADEGDGVQRAETSTEAVRFSRVSSMSLTRVVPDPASYMPGVTMPSEVILTIGWNVLSHVELEPAHCGDETCEADHGYLGTITADDLTLRTSEAADGVEAIRQVLAFSAALSDATARAAG